MNITKQRIIIVLIVQTIIGSLFAVGYGVVKSFERGNHKYGAFSGKTGGIMWSDVPIMLAIIAGSCVFGLIIYIAGKYLGSAKDKLHK